MINKGILRQFMAAIAGKKNQIASKTIKRFCIMALFNYAAPFEHII